MRSFREEYQKEIDRVGTFHLDVKQVSDEIHHHKMRNVRRRRMMVSVASGAAIFLVVGGMATAMNYGGGFIQVRHNGFSITNRPAGDEDSAEGGVDAGQIPAPVKERARQETEEIDEPETPCIIAYSMEPAEYDSLVSFQEQTDITVPMPDMRLLGGDAAQQYIHTLGDQVYIRIQDTQERSFSIIQVDHRGDQAYASSSAYSGEAANERNYTTAQGYTYKVIDIMDGDEISSIECAISLYGRDLLVGFRGYTQEEAYEVLQAMDLGVYTVDE